MAHSLLIYSIVVLTTRSGTKSSMQIAPKIASRASDIESKGTSKELTDAALDRLVSRLRVVRDVASLELAIGVGRLVVEELYGGDIEQLREHGPHRASYRQLAASADLPMSASTLWRYVSIFELCDRLGGSERWIHLGATHLRTVFGLSADHQTTLLDRADAKQWTVRRLQQEVKLLRAPIRGKPGRPPLPRFVRSIHALRRYTENDYELLGDLDAAQDLALQDLEDLHETIRSLGRSCAKLDASLSHSIRERRPFQRRPTPNRDHRTGAASKNSSLGEVRHA